MTIDSNMYIEYDRHNRENFKQKVAKYFSQIENEE